MAKERPYQCDICQMRFTQSSSLNRHKKIHTGGLPGQPAIALDELIHSSFLHTCACLPKFIVYHTQYSSGVECLWAGRLPPPVCECEWVPCLSYISDTPFDQTCYIVALYLVEEHRRALLEKVRPYQCHICFMRFTQKSSLGRHGKIHTGRHFALTSFQVDNEFVELLWFGGDEPRRGAAPMLYLSFVGISRGAHPIADQQSAPLSMWHLWQEVHSEVQPWHS